MKCKNV